MGRQTSGFPSQQGIAGTPVDPASPGGQLIDPAGGETVPSTALDNVWKGDGGGGWIQGPTPGSSPSGPAGGDLSNTYPNPLVATVGGTAAAVIGAHPADAVKHRVINDAGSSTIDLFSASKILAEVATLEAGVTRKPGVATVTDGLGNITLSGEQLLNGVTTNLSDVLVTDQTDKTKNGIYVSDPSTWSLRSDSDGSPANEVKNGNLVRIIDTVSSKFNHDYTLVSPDPISVGTDDQEWEEHPNIELGTTSGTAAEGNDPRIPTQDENNALAGTDGVPSSTNKYVTDSDPRHSLLLLEFGTTSGVPNQGERFLDREGISGTAAPVLLPAAAVLKGITITVDSSPGATREYEVRVISDPGGTDTLIGSVLVLTSAAVEASRRDLSAAIGSGVKWGVVLVRTAGSGPSGFSDARVEVEVRMP